MFSDEVILKIKNGENVQDNMQRLYCENLGLLHTICNSMQLISEDRDEFYQLAYLALHDAVNAYIENMESTKYNFIAYYRQCLRHAYYVYRLEMKYPVRINQKVYKEKTVSKDRIEYLSIYDIYTEYEYDLVEDRIIASAVWSEVNRLISDTNAEILIRHFRKKHTYREIGVDYGICSNSVRQRIVRSLHTLRCSHVLREIAQDYFGIYIKR